MVEYQIKKQKVSPSSTSKEFGKRRPQSKPKSSRKKSKEYVRFAPTLFVINEEEESQRSSIGLQILQALTGQRFPLFAHLRGLIQPMARKDLTYTSLSSYPWRKPSLHQTLQEKFQRVKRLTLEPRDLNSFRARLDKAIVMIVLGIFFCFFFTHTLSLTLALMSRASEAREAEKTIDEGMYEKSWTYLKTKVRIRQWVGQNEIRNRMKKYVHSL
ncbi:hypothetical protein BDQ17DRAFT_1423196 [Cyathus striatus]|nr:hypothetical protein BDQ17DRAFT_1423196 [Cyathus striatus]